MKIERRNFLKTLVVGGVALAVAPVLRIRDAIADLVKADDPLVVALGYVAVAKSSKDRKDKKANCKNCQFYSDTTGKEKQAKCQLIPSGEVAAEGWCRSYSKRKA
jgi:hypothetical protein